MFPLRRFLLLALSAALLAPLLGGCASGSGGGSGSSSTSSSSSSSSGGGTVSRLQFRLTVNDNGVIEASQGLYAIVFNSFGDPIDVTARDKFTDFLVYDSNNLVWYTRQTSSTDNSFTFVASGTATQSMSFTPDRRTLLVTFDPQDVSSPLNQFIKSSRFTCVAVTTDRSGYLGRVIDTLGPGPDLAHDTLYTLTVDKSLGAVSPLPASYPSDPLQDWIVQADNPPTFPYVNYDIQSFEVITP